MAASPPEPRDVSKGGPPAIPPGAVASPIPQGMFDRLKEMMGHITGRGPRRSLALPDPGPLAANTRPTAEPQAQQPDPRDTTGYMGPGKPQQSVISTSYRDVAGRAFDYQAGYNSAARVRQWEGVTIETLRNIAENYDLLRLAIETRKDQVAKIGWSILPRKKPGAQFRPKADQRCVEVEKCLRRPDGVHTWDQWIRMVTEDSFVVDGVALFRRRTPEGKPFALEVVDSGTVQPLIDITGRSPLSPHPAYSQIIKGTPVAHYTRDEMTYWRRNPRSNKVYGFGPVEQIVRTAMLGLGRLAKQLSHYTDGNMPAALLPTPVDWSAEQLREFQQMFDLLARDPTQKAKTRFVPGGVGAPIILNTEAVLFGPFDEWLARMICYAFSLPPFPFVQQTNKATAESQYDSAREEGLGPFLNALKAMLDIEIEEFFGQPDLELVWDDVRQLDPTEQAARDKSDMADGIIGVDDIRATRGQEATGAPALVRGIGPMGFMTWDQINQCIADGTNMPQPPMAMDALAAGGLENASPEVLRQLGIDPESLGGGGAPGAAGPGGGRGAAPGPAGSSLASVASRTPRLPEVAKLLASAGARSHDDMPSRLVSIGPARGQRPQARGMPDVRHPPGVRGQEGQGDVGRRLGGAAGAARA